MIADLKYSVELRSNNISENKEFEICYSTSYTTAVPLSKSSPFYQRNSAFVSIQSHNDLASRNDVYVLCCFVNHFDLCILLSVAGNATHVLVSICKKATL